MPQLESYFVDESADFQHPLLRSLDEAEARPDFKEARVEVVRERATLGYKPLKLVLHLLTEVALLVKEDWDDDLNNALILRKVKAISAENEKVRTALGLRASLESAESRFGDGYFNAALIHYIVNSPFKDQSALVEVLPHVHRNGVEPSRRLDECRAMIDAAIRGRARELTQYLGYPLPEAETILAGAIASYLDDRFSVTNRRLMGLL